MSLQTIIELNNHTLVSLHEDNTSIAIESSSSALACQQVLQRDQRHVPSTAAADDRIDQCMLLSQPTHNQSHDEMTQEPFIYSHGIVLPAEITDHSVITPVLIFNLALSHQQRGECLRYFDIAASNSMMDKARRLYDLAHISVNAENNVLFHFAIVNNVAVIDRRLGNTAAANEYFEYLMSLFMALVDRGDSRNLRQLQGFLANLPSAMVTAAAA